MRAHSELATRAQIEFQGRYGEVSLGFAEASARQEGRRCLRCDAVTSCPVVQVKREVPA